MENRDWESDEESTRLISKLPIEGQRHSMGTNLFYPDLWSLMRTQLHVRHHLRERELHLSHSRKTVFRTGWWGHLAGVADH
jgi:hypothetical protein